MNRVEEVGPGFPGRKDSLDGGWLLIRLEVSIGIQGRVAVDADAAIDGASGRPKDPSGGNIGDPTLGMDAPGGD